MPVALNFGLVLHGNTTVGDWNLLSGGSFLHKRHHVIKSIISFRGCRAPISYHVVCCGDFLRIFLLSFDVTALEVGIPATVSGNVNDADEHNGKQLLECLQLSTLNLLFSFLLFCDVTFNAPCSECFIVRFQYFIHHSHETPSQIHISFFQYIDDCSELLLKFHQRFLSVLPELVQG